MTVVISPHPCQYLFPAFFSTTILVGVKYYLSWFSSAFLAGNGGSLTPVIPEIWEAKPRGSLGHRPSFHVLVSHLYIFVLVTFLFKYFAYFLKWVFVHLLLGCMSIYSGYKFFIRYVFCIVFSFYLFCILKCKFWWGPISPFFSFMDCVFVVISKKSLPNLRSQRFSHRFSSKSFIVLALHLTLRSLFSLFSCMVWNKCLSSACGYPIVPASFVSNIMIYFCTPNSVPLTYVSILMAVPHRLDCSFIVKFKIGKWKSSNFALFLKLFWLF